MAYQVLARKWRPRSFHEMVGQMHVLKALVNALDNQRIHHAYLFTGTRGVGKTTISRIFAKCLNCEKGISATPCGVCSICQEVDAGRFVDLIEIDAASRTKVEDTRDILDNVQYAPSRGRYKIYLIDEVHMLSTHSFNALLKTLEEPPEHVKFLLATTDPQKLPVTILSRCLQFSLKSISAEHISHHLSFVLNAEKIPFEMDALWLIARAAEGSMRDAMSLTDQSIAFGNGQVLLRDVSNMLGAIDKKQVYILIKLLFGKNVMALFSFIKELAAQDVNWSELLAELLQSLHQIAVAQVLPDAIDNTSGQLEVISTLAKQIPAEDVHLFYQIGLSSRRDLLLAPDLRSGFEMAVLRMLAFIPSGVQDNSIIVPSSQPNNEEAKLATASDDAVIKKISASVAVKPGLTNPVAPSAAINEDNTVAYEVVTDYNEYAALETKELEHTFAQPVQAVDTEAPSLKEESTVDVEYVKNSHDELLIETDLVREWLQLFPKLNVSGVLANVASNSALVSKSETLWVFHLAPNCSALLNENHNVRLGEALSSVLMQPITVQIKVSSSLYLTPAKLDLLQREQRQKQAEQDILNDVSILALQEKFSADIVQSSIEPILKGE